MKQSTTVSVEAGRKDGEPALAILEEGEPLEVVPGGTIFETTFDVGRKVFGNGVSVQVRTSNVVDGSRESRDAAFDENLEMFTAALRRNKDKLQRFLRAALREAGDGSLWDPTGDGLGEPERPSSPPPPLAAGVGRPVTPVPQAAPGSVPVVGRPGVKP